MHRSYGSRSCCRCCCGESCRYSEERIHVLRRAGDLPSLELVVHFTQTITCSWLASTHFILIARLLGQRRSPPIRGQDHHSDVRTPSLVGRSTRCKGRGKRTIKTSTELLDSPLLFPSHPLLHFRGKKTISTITELQILTPFIHSAFIPPPFPLSPPSPFQRKENH